MSLPDRRVDPVESVSLLRSIVEKKFFLGGWGQWREREREREEEERWGKVDVDFELQEQDSVFILSLVATAN